MLFSHATGKILKQRKFACKGLNFWLPKKCVVDFTKMHCIRTIISCLFARIL